MMKYFAFVLFALLTAFFDVRADRRSYVWTYEYLINEPGSAEIEYYYTLSAPKMKELKGGSFLEQKVELEVGMTKHFDFSIYQKFKSDAVNKSIFYGGFDLRARFKIGEKNQFPLDPLIYLEYGNNASLTNHKLEFKLILAKDFGPFNFAVNPIFEMEEENSWEGELGYAIGFCYRPFKLWYFGVESKGNKNEQYLGLVFSHGKDDLWINISPTFLVSKNLGNTKEFIIRAIVGIGIK